MHWCEGNRCPERATHQGVAIGTNKCIIVRYVCERCMKMLRRLPITFARLDRLNATEKEPPHDAK